MIMMLTLPVTSSMEHKCDLVGNGKLDMSFDGGWGQTYVRGSGDIALGQIANADGKSFSALTLIDSDLGSIRTKTPEYDGMFVDVKNLNGSMQVSRTETIEEEATKHGLNVLLNLSGNGSIDESMFMKDTRSRPAVSVLEFAGEFNYTSILDMTESEMWTTTKRLL